MESNMKHNVFAGRIARVLLAVLLGAGILAVASCYYMPALSGGSAAKVNVRASAGPPSSLPPVDITSVALIVAGPGMDTVTKSYDAGTTTATLTIPSGAARTFTLLENTPSVSLMGDATVDLAPGETKNITISPVLSATQIIVPDYGSQRLAQIADMKGTGWTTLTDSFNGFHPFDVDYDDQGRIYIADYNRGVLVTNDVTVTPIALDGATLYSVISIAMDRAHGVLYCVSNYGASLWSEQVTSSPAIETSIDLSTIFPGGFTLLGIAADSDGFLYMVTTSPSYAVVKIDPTVPRILAEYTGPLVSPYDVLVNGGYIYVSDQGNPSYPIPGRIIRLSRDLKFVDDFTGPPSDPFYGPEGFVAILNKPITVADKTNYPTNQARLVSFDNMTGGGWKTYGSFGSGQDQFMFYYSAC
jgi:hypothetical protein